MKGSKYITKKPRSAAVVAMRAVVVWLVVAAAVAVADVVDEPWVEEEDVDEPYEETYEDEHEHYRSRREINEDPYEEHVRVKRCCEEPRRARRSYDYVRTPRQVHQYEVHEFTDDTDPSSPPYEEMLAASAEHYHRVYAAPGAPKSARYLDPEVSHVNVASAPVNNSPFISKLSSQAPAVFYHEQVALPPVLSPVEVPIPVASVPLVPLKQLDGDQVLAAAGHHQHNHKNGHSHAQGGGHKKQAKHYAEHGGKVKILWKH